MRLLYSVSLFVLCAALSSGPAEAQGRTSDVDSANWVLPGCKAFAENRPDLLAFRQGICAGAITALTFIGSSLPEGYRTCPPKTATHGQKIRVVIRYLEQQPERLHEPFNGLVLEALSSAWPCKDQPR
jgi:hypothetical protein